MTLHLAPHSESGTAFWNGGGHLVQTRQGKRSAVPEPFVLGTDPHGTGARDEERPTAVLPAPDPDTMRDMAQVPINPRVLEWAMRTSGSSKEDLAAVAQVKPEMIDLWLSGEVKPNKTQTSRMGKRLGRSTQFFLLPEPPSIVDKGAQLRGSVHKKSADPQQEQIQIRSAQRTQRIARWASTRSDQPHVHLPSATPSAEDYAERLRHFLGWSTEEQIKLAKTSKTQVFKGLRRTIEEAGVLVLLQDAGRDNFRGFSLPDLQVPLIYINSAYKQPALRTYTLLHELAHLGRGDENVCYEPDSRVERWCEQFAADFLLPVNHLRRYLNRSSFTRAEYEDPDQVVRLVSNRYGSSWMSAAIRLKGLGLVDQRLVDQVRNAGGEPASGQGFSRERRTTPVIRLSEYGTAFSRLVIDAVENDVLSDLDARKYLHATGPQLREIASALRQGAK